MKPIFIGLKDEKTALSKEVTELKEQLTIVEREHNTKIIEIGKKNESANKLLLQELSTAKDASTKALATKIEADLSLQSLEEMLALAKQEAINFAKKVANEEELFKSKLTAQLQVVEEFKKRETKVMILLFMDRLQRPSTSFILSPTSSSNHVGQIRIS